MPIKRTHIFGTLAAGAVAAGLTAHFSGEKEPSQFERQLESLVPPTPMSVSAMSVPRATEENIAALRTLFEKTRDDLTAEAPVLLAKKKAASPDGEGRIEISGDTANIYEHPLIITYSNFDVDRQAERAADRIALLKPEIFESTGDEFEDSVYWTLNDGLQSWYVPSAKVYQLDEPVATYDVDSDRVCQPMAAAWQDASKEKFDCFPAASLAPNTALAADVAAIRQHLAHRALAR